MKILIDECLPATLKSTFAALGHECETVREAGHGSKKNRLKDLLPLVPACAQALQTIHAGQAVEVGAR